MSPQQLIRIERDLHRTIIAARALESNTVDSLQELQQLLAEVRLCAQSTANGGTGGAGEPYTRLLSHVLGFEFAVTGVKVAFNDLESYQRTFRDR